MGEGSGASGEERTLTRPRGLRGANAEASSRTSAKEGTVTWEEYPERVGVTFNLSKQVITELDELRLGLEGDTRSSRSEIAEAALRIAVEDARGRGGDSELVKRLSGRRAAHAEGAPDEGGLITRRSVDETGLIVETTYTENGEVVDEDVVASVDELPVEAEYVDEQGRLVSVAKDERGNTFEQIMDEDFNTLGARLLPSAD